MPTGASFPIVGIGASAGGLAALKTLFSTMPEKPGLAFVVVVHLSPQHESYLPNLLQVHCPMPVHQVTETTEIERNNVYVIPPNANLNTIDTHLRLSKLEEQRAERAPIDHFFRTLAATHDGHAIGIILTGTGSDGTLGIRRIKEAGGLTIAQDPHEAEHDGMPRSAIASGMIDLVLPLQRMSVEILRFAHTHPRVPLAGNGDDVDGNRVLQKIFAQVRGRTGHDFSHYKRSTVMRRIQRRMQLHHVEALPTYLDLLRERRDEALELFDDLLITVTEFFRDRKVFERLQQVVIPRLFEGKSSQDRLRVWSVGCSTGEEAYSLAMLLLEEAGRREVHPQIQVFATDLHESALAKAREGVYPEEIAQDVSAERLERFFIHENGHYRVRREVRELVVFAPHNLLRDPPFSHLNLIVCRNMLIYLQRDVQQDVVELFHYALEADGLLQLGSSESIERTDLFVAEDKDTCLYRKRNVPARELAFPLFPMVVGGGLQERRGPTMTPPRSHEHPSYGSMHEYMVERYAPPSVLVNSEREVVHSSAHAGNYLQIPGGEPTKNVFKLIREPLRIELRSALHAATESGKPVRSRPVFLSIDGQPQHVFVRVLPATEPDLKGFFLILFDEVGEGTGQQGGDTDLEHDTTLAELEAELDLNRQRLQAVIEEYEASREEMQASNEELQSANEELRSTMEELETSKEELQSMNEELSTLNQENRHRVEELSQLSSDLQNLMAATEIATLFLDRDLRILRFTPQVADLFSIRRTDQGRPLSDLNHHLGYPDLQSDAREVLDRLRPKEREVESENGRWYLTRILPYRGAGDRIEGVVITMIDITARKQAEEAREALTEQLEIELRGTQRLQEISMLLLHNGDSGSLDELIVDGAMALLQADAGSMHVLDPEGEDLRLLAVRGFAPESMEYWQRVSSSSERICGKVLQSAQRVIVPDVEACDELAGTLELDAYRQSGIRAVQSTPLVSRSGRLVGRLSTHWRTVYEPPQRELRLLDLLARQAADLLERTWSEEALRESERRLRAANERKSEFLATLAHELRNPLAPLRNTVEILKRTEDNEEVHQRGREMIERQLDHMVRLVDDLLDVSRITRDIFELRRQRVNLNVVLEQAIETSRPQVEAAGHDLVAKLPSRPVYLDGDPVRLAQVFSNLLNNACKYTQEGGRIRLTVKRQGDEVRVSIADNGEGIPPDKLETIFEMFAQANHSLDKIHGGLGIGLTLVRRLVELHGGSVVAYSEGLGRGSEFVVRLPVLIEAHKPSQPPAAVPAEPVRVPPRRILVVDDNEDSAWSMAELLALSGHQTRVAHEGPRALVAAGEFEPEVILLDLGLPGMSGYDVCRALREQPLGKDVVVLAVTGWGQEEDQRKSREAGFDGHLVKPVEYKALTKLLAEMKPASS